MLPSRGKVKALMTLERIDEASRKHRKHRLKRAAGRQRRRGSVSRERSRLDATQLGRSRVRSVANYRERQRRLFEERRERQLRAILRFFASDSASIAEECRTGERADIGFIPTPGEDICTLVRTANRGITSGHEVQKCLPMAPVALLSTA
jgi:hypothetical protein